MLLTWGHSPSIIVTSELRAHPNVKSKNSHWVHVLGKAAFPKLDDEQRPTTSADFNEFDVCDEIRWEW